MTSLTLHRRHRPNFPAPRDAGSPPTPDAATTAPLPIAVALAAREISADALRLAADLWDDEPGDLWVRQDRPSTFLRELAAEMLGGPEHRHRHRTGRT